MKKFYEYNEPEFKVVVANCEDVLTASGPEDPTNPGHLSTVSSTWEMGTFGL